MFNFKIIANTFVHLGLHSLNRKNQNFNGKIFEVML